MTSLKRAIMKLTNKMSQMHMAGRSSRSTMDNILIVNAIIQQNAKKKQPTYMMFADAVKCFDKLWLKDCILELINIGMNKYDAMMIYELNKEASAHVRTPVGETESFAIKEVENQGTILGPLMCCAEKATVNTIH